MRLQSYQRAIRQGLSELDVVARSRALQGSGRDRVREDPPQLVSQFRASVRVMLFLRDGSELFRRCARVRFRVSVRVVLFLRDGSELFRRRARVRFRVNVRVAYRLRYGNGQFRPRVCDPFRCRTRAQRYWRPVGCLLWPVLHPAQTNRS